MLFKIEKLIAYLLLLLLPTQLGKHFWPSFAYVLGQRVDYLSPTIYVTDILVICLFILLVFRYLFVFARSVSRSCHSGSSTVLSSLSKDSSGIFKSEEVLRIRQIARSWTSQDDRQKKIGVRVTLILLSVLWISLGIVFSKTPLLGWYGLLKILEFIFFGWYISHFFIENKTNMLICLSAGVIFESILAIAQFGFQHSLGGVFYFFGERTFNGQTPGIANASINGELLLRPYATFPHPNVLAGYLVIIMTTIISNFKFQISNIKKIIFTATIILGTIALFLSLSRVAIVVWVLVSVFIAYGFLSKFRKSTAYVLILTSLFFLFIFSPLLPRFTRISLDDQSVTQRLELNDAALSMIRDHPILGVGINNFLVALPSHLKQTGKVVLLQPVHNIFLLITSEIGIPGAILLLYFLCYAGYKNLVCNSRVRGNPAGFPIRSGMTDWKTIFNYKLLLVAEVVFLGMFDHYFLTLQQGQLLLAFISGLIISKT